MLIRFCLYGFLKNQRYFEPFFMLALLSHGLSFFGIGVLVAAHSLTLNLLEIPSGAMADAWGRRRCMMASFAAYVLSFLAFALSSSYWLLFPAMILYGIGDSFRTGTHKAMIFEWLRLQGRESERTKIYGITRGWSQFGSAVSAVLAAFFVLVTQDFRAVFLIATVPYLANLVNFAGYPEALDGKQAEGGLSGRPLTGFWEMLFGSTRDALRRRGVRSLLAESMAWEGVFDAVEDYLQPMLILLLLSMAIGSNDAVGGRTGAMMGGELSVSIENAATHPLNVIVIGGTYAAIALFSGFASRSSYRLVELTGSEERTSQWMWAATVALYALLGIGDLARWAWLAVGAFLCLCILRNVWRPILIGRFDREIQAAQGASILSIESQSRRVVTLFVAPLVGLAIDRIAVSNGIGEFWPIAVAGLMTALPMLMKHSRNNTAEGASSLQ